MDVVISFVTRRFFGAITGGFFFDKHLSVLVNTIHFYTWLFFLLFPLSLVIVCGSTDIVAYGYLAAIVALFTIIKITLWFIHKAFDQEKKLKEDKEETKEIKEETAKTLQMEEGQQGIQVETEQSKVEIGGDSNPTPQKENEDKSKANEDKDNESEEEPLQTKKLKDSSHNVTSIVEGRNSEVVVTSSIDSPVMKETASNWTKGEIDSEDSLKDGTQSEGELSEGEIKVDPALRTSKEKKTKNMKEDEIEEKLADKSGKEEEAPLQTQSKEEITEVGISSLLDDLRSYGMETGEGNAKIYTYVDEFGELQRYIIFEETTNHATNSEPTLDPSLQIRASNIGNMESDSEEENIKASANLPAKEEKTEPKQLPVVLPLLCWNLQLPFKRLFILSLLDKNETWFEVFFSIFLAGISSYLGISVLRFYAEVPVFIVCFILASAHYSLLKSPQPDASSPRHDHNKWNAFNRSFYFSIIAAAILILDAIQPPLGDPDNIILYGSRIYWYNFVVIFKNILLFLLPWVPFFSLFGLLPQVNTFIIYLIEQINIHLFGSSGTPNLFASIFDFVRSLIILGILIGVGWGSQFNSQFLFALYIGLIVGLTYLHSRLVTDPTLFSHLVCRWRSTHLIGAVNTDPDPYYYPTNRLIIDLVITIVLIVVITGIHASTVFTYFWPYGFYTVAIFGVAIGFIKHYLIPILRKPYPFMLFGSPFLQSNEYRTFEAHGPAKVMWFEQLYTFIGSFEKMFIYPFLFITSTTHFVDILVSKWTLIGAIILVSIVSIKLLRGCFSDASQHYLILFFTLVFFNYDWRYSETFLIDFFVASLVVPKLLDIILKVNFILIYVAPWNLSWGAAVHAILQPFGVPHTALCIFQIVWSAITQAPIYPFIGSSLFLISYARPVKFWERNYKTNRVDNSQIKLSETLENTYGSEYNLNNLNSIFYEHLMVSLQASLNKEIEAGRLGNVGTGDFFIIVNDKLSAMLHIIELGNGYCTFQIRGMEFKGTYCQERELEAINRADYSDDDDWLSPFDCLRIPKFLPFKEAFGIRWNSWDVLNTALMLQTYSIGLNPATSMLNLWSLRMVLIKYYVGACIFYLIKDSSFESWLHNPSIKGHITSFSKNHIDFDPIFSKNIDEDFDELVDGISLTSFGQVYSSWIRYCLLEKIKSDGTSNLSPDESAEGGLVFNFCYAISLLARRCLIMNPHNSSSTSLFLQRYHALFKGDFRISSIKDEFVLTDIDIMNRVLGKAVRMSLKLHQDHFIGEDFNDHENLYNTLEEYEKSLICCHEGDPLWRRSILQNVPNMLSLRKYTDPHNQESNEFMVLSLTLRHMKFRVIKLNRESVRGLWAGQVQEITFLGNTNSERGSIQQLRTVVRNLVNQSCDFPVGYPIFVSPLSTSYSSFWPEVFGEYKILNVLKQIISKPWFRKSNAVNK